MRKLWCALAPIVLSMLLTPAPGCRPSKLRAPMPPPASRIEAKPEAPSAAHTFIPGDWTWDDARELWLWRPGYYAKRPDKAKSYQRGKWVKRGTTYLWIPGKWIY